MNCQACGAELVPGTVSCPGCAAPSGTMPPRVVHPLGGPAAAVTVLLAGTAAASLGSIGIAALEVAVILLYLPLIPVFIVWFYRARMNADGHGWHQRRAPGWAIGAWFVPVIWFWFPYQIMADIWRAGLPASQRSRPAWLPIGWWGCWLLAWFTGFTYTRTSTGTFHGVTVGFFLGATLFSKLFEAAAAIAAILVVRAISKDGVGRAPEPVWPGHPSPAAPAG
jgi:Domain of unknown function (DUF4328)